MFQQHHNIFRVREIAGINNNSNNTTQAAANVRKEISCIYRLAFRSDDEIISLLLLLLLLLPLLLQLLLLLTC